MPELSLFSGGPTAAAAHLEIVTPSDEADLTAPTRALRCTGGTGAIRVTTVGGEQVAIPDVADGERLDVQVTRVWASDTTYSGTILAMW